MISFSLWQRAEEYLKMGLKWECPSFCRHGNFAKPEVYEIMLTLILQDCLFLVCRMMFIFKYNMSSDWMKVAAMKNVFNVFLLINQLCMVSVSRILSEIEYKKRYF